MLRQPASTRRAEDATLASQERQVLTINMAERSVAGERRAVLGILPLEVIDRLVIGAGAANRESRRVGVFTSRARRVAQLE